MCLFGLQKHIAPNMVIKSNNVFQTTFINFNGPQFETSPTKRKNTKLHHLGSKTQYET